MKQGNYNTVPTFPRAKVLRGRRKRCGFKCLAKCELLQDDSGHFEQAFNVPQRESFQPKNLALGRSEEGESSSVWPMLKKVSPSFPPLQTWPYIPYSSPGCFPAGELGPVAEALEAMARALPALTRSLNPAHPLALG